MHEGSWQRQQALLASANGVLSHSLQTNALPPFCPLCHPRCVQEHLDPDHDPVEGMLGMVSLQGGCSNKNKTVATGLMHADRSLPMLLRQRRQRRLP